MLQQYYPWYLSEEGWVGPTFRLDVDSIQSNIMWADVIFTSIVANWSWLLGGLY